jgi:hypothetical protein
MFTVPIGPGRFVSPLPVDLGVHILCNHSNSILHIYTLKVEAIYSSETESRPRRPQCIVNHTTDNTANKSLLVFVGVMKCYTACR